VCVDTLAIDSAANSATPATVEVLPTPEDLAAAPLAIGVITDRVQEAMDYIKVNQPKFMMRNSPSSKLFLTPSGCKNLEKLSQISLP
jgi:hypothetical protein